MGAGTRAVACVRVSTNKQVEHGLSLEAQQAKLMAYATLCEFDLVAMEVDWEQLWLTPEESHTKNSQAVCRPKRSEAVFSITPSLISPARLLADSSLLHPSDKGSILRHFCISHMRQSRHVANIPMMGADPLFTAR